MWQYSSEGRVNGISGNVDMDECYVDYPALIKNGGFNGFVKPKTTEKPAAPAALKGDLNGDGKVNVADVALLAAQVKGIKPLK
jgi:GH25 family lysozyme M1 (1,4-beta-N-acetylmuramidase)